MLGFVGTLAGALVGALASVATTLIAAWTNRAHQAHSDSLARLERSREFQRSNLLDLQEALAMNARLVGRAHMEDVRFYRSNPGADRRPMLSNDLDHALSESNRRLSLLTERIADDDLRKDIKDLRRLMSRVFDALSAEDSKQALLAFSAPFEKTAERIGTVLRSHY